MIELISNFRQFFTGLLMLTMAYGAPRADHGETLCKYHDGGTRLILEKIRHLSEIDGPNGPTRISITLEEGDFGKSFTSVKLSGNLLGILIEGLAVAHDGEKFSMENKVYVMFHKGKRITIHSNGIEINLSRADAIDLRDKMLVFYGIDPPKKQEAQHDVEPREINKKSGTDIVVPKL